MFILEICNNQTFKNIHESAKINPDIAAITSETAIAYAFQNNTRFELGEKVIAEDARNSYYYALEILECPFPLGEPAIATNAQFSLYYASAVLKGRFKLGEYAIAKDTTYSYFYTKNILKNDFYLDDKLIRKFYKE